MSYIVGGVAGPTSRPVPAPLPLRVLLGWLFAEQQGQEEFEHANVVEDLHRVVEDGGNIEEEGGYGMDNA